MSASGLVPVITRKAKDLMKYSSSNYVPDGHDPYIYTHIYNLLYLMWNPLPLQLPIIVTSSVLFQMIT